MLGDFNTNVFKKNMLHMQLFYFNLCLLILKKEI
jgi:hypothetical protein